MASGDVVTVRSADRVTPPRAPEIVTVPDVQATVDIVNVALVAPAGAVTLAGTIAIEGLLLESATATPPAGADVVRITVPVNAAPPVTLAGFSETDDSVCGVT